VSENRVPKRIFGLRREEVAGGWRRLHSEELHPLYISPNVIKVIKSERMGWAGRVARVRYMRNAYKILVVKSEGKIPLGRHTHRWTRFIWLRIGTGGCVFEQGNLIYLKVLCFVRFVFGASKLYSVTLNCWCRRLRRFYQDVGFGIDVICIIVDVCSKTYL
jgi:hypothetical protein